MIEEYERTKTSIRQREGRERTALLRMLFSDSDDAALAERELGNQYGISGSGLFLVAAVAPAEGNTADDHDWSDHLRRAGLNSVWIREQHTDFGLIALGADANDLPQKLRLLTNTFHQHAARAGISAPYDSLRASARARINAYAALWATAEDTFPVLIFDGDPLSEIVVAAPDAARRLARDVFHHVMDLPTQDSHLLLETVETYFRKGGSYAATADVLFCHPNTVRYRLRRVEELTGLQFNDPNHSARLALALKALKYAPRRRTEVTDIAPGGTPQR